MVNDLHIKCDIKLRDAQHYFRYENGELQELEDCGELHDDMCAYFEFACSAAAAPSRQVRTRGNQSVMEQIRTRLFEEGGNVIGRRVCKVVGKSLLEGEVSVGYCKGRSVWARE